MLLLPLAMSAQDDEQDGCRAGKRTQERRINGFVVRIEPLNPSNVYEGCRGFVKGARQVVPIPVEDWDIRFNDATGKDLNGDGYPEVVFEGYSGGAHCCWTYWIISLGKLPGLLWRIYNQRDGRFVDLDSDGRTEFLTLDGAFDYFDDMLHAASPFPRVVLRLDGMKLMRVNSDFWLLYENDIFESARHLSAEKIRGFRDGDGKTFRENYPDDWEYTKQHVLEIVLANLYGGREAEAWRALRELWPPADQVRIRAEILKTAKEGFLGDSSRPDLWLPSISRKVRP